MVWGILYLLIAYIVTPYLCYRLIGFDRDEERALTYMLWVGAPVSFIGLSLVGVGVIFITKTYKPLHTLFHYIDERLGL